MARVPVDERRQQFIEAAWAVVAEFGVEGATTRRIAKAARAPLASLHYCYDSKEDLLAAVWEEHLRRLKERVPPSEGSPVGLAHAAAERLREAIQWMTENEEFTVATTELLLWARRQDPDLGRRSFDMYLNASIRQLATRLAPGESEELVAPVARMLAAAFDGLTLQWVAYHDTTQLEHDVEMWGTAIELLVSSRTPASPARKQPRSKR